VHRVVAALRRGLAGHGHISRKMSINFFIKSLGERVGGPLLGIKYLAFIARIYIYFYYYFFFFLLSPGSIG
jgi:hypothetical protein